MMLLERRSQKWHTTRLVFSSSFPERHLFGRRASNRIHCLQSHSVCRIRSQQTASLPAVKTLFPVWKTERTVVDDRYLGCASARTPFFSRLDGSRTVKLKPCVLERCSWKYMGGVHWTTTSHVLLNTWLPTLVSLWIVRLG